jgi:hypothetical protein
MKTIIFLLGLLLLTSCISNTGLGDIPPPRSSVGGDGDQINYVWDISPLTEPATKDITVHNEPSVVDIR